MIKCSTDYAIDINFNLLNYILQNMFSYLWGGSSTKPVQENENPELAMRADLDKHKNFKTNIDGTMEFEDFLVLRSIIMR